jgi:phosphoenolpyruvate synthase/pyruvate phosphate dikinase
MIVGFDNTAPREIVGCKGHNLSRMWQAGLPVPSGFCVTWDRIESIDSGELNCALARLGSAAFAVRSSAVEEDADSASFAGILLSRLNVTTTGGVLSVLTEIRNSALAPAAEGYSHRRNVESSLRVAAIVQTFVAADASGVLFMRDPLTGARQTIVEACWGLGSGVVEGLVRPDRWVITADGTVISSHIADKDIAVVPSEQGGTKETAVDAACRRRPCLDEALLKELSKLAGDCERLFGSPQDIEWATSAGRIWLLQSRPITSQAPAL